MEFRSGRVSNIAKGTVLVAIALIGCKGSNGAAAPAGQQGAAQLSPPVTMNAALSSRHIRTCSELTHVPSPAEAAALIQCGQEREDRDGNYLFQNLQIRMGAPRPYIYNQDSHLNDIDTTLKVYPIRVTGDWYGCHGGPTCSFQHFVNADGDCWKTTFGNWECYTSGGYTYRDPNETEQPGPTTY